MANVWKNLGASSQGKKLITELKKMQNEVCDSRNWDEDQTRESANHAADALEKVIRKIQKNDPTTKSEERRDPAKDQYS